MKTLDDAMMTPGVIPAGYYKSEWGTPYIQAEHDPQVGFLVYFNEATDMDDEGLTPSELRRIAHHLDPQPDSSNHSKTSNCSPVIPEGWDLVPQELTDDMGDFLDSYLSAMIGPQEAWAGTLTLCPAAPLRTEAAVRAEARLATLEEAAKIVEALGDPHSIGAAIRLRRFIRAVIADNGGAS